MSKKESPYIGRPGRWLLFAGFPFAVLAVLFVCLESRGTLEHIAGEKALPYLLFFGPVVLGLGGKLLYDRFPARLVVPFGIVGWIVGFSLISWFFWFGPAAWH